MTIAVQWKRASVDALELELGDAAMEFRSLERIGDEKWGEWGADVSVRPIDGPAHVFVDEVAAQLGLRVEPSSGGVTPPGAEGSAVVFQYRPYHVLHAKLGFVDARDEQHEVYLNVEPNGPVFRATFSTMDPYYDRRVVALLAHGVRDGHRRARVRLDKRKPRVETIEQAFALAERGYEALMAAVEADRERFIGWAPHLVRAAAEARSQPPSLSRRDVLANVRAILRCLESPELAGEYARGILDADAAVRRDTRISLSLISESRLRRNPTFLDREGVTAELVRALDTFISRFVLSGEPGEVEHAITLRDELARAQ